MTARISRRGHAPAYRAPLHEGVITTRLQGHEAGPTDRFWVGHSTYPPGSRALTSATVAETVYVCLAGELDLTVEEQGATWTQTLGAGDCAHLTEATVRSVVNTSEQEAELLVIVATPQHD